MRHDLDFLSILRRHFLIFMSTVFTALFAMTMTLLVLLEQYPPALADFAEYLVASSCGVSLYLSLANLMVIRGRPWGVWPIVVAMFACILTVLLHWGQRGLSDPLSFLGLLFPLLTLLMFNSQRYRGMLETMVLVREQRIAWRKKHKRK